MDDKIYMCVCVCVCVCVHVCVCVSVCISLQVYISDCLGVSRVGFILMMFGISSGAICFVYGPIVKYIPECFVLLLGAIIQVVWSSSCWYGGESQAMLQLSSLSLDGEQEMLCGKSHIQVHYGLK